MNNARRQTLEMTENFFLVPAAGRNRIAQMELEFLFQQVAKKNVGYLGRSSVWFQKNSGQYINFVPFASVEPETLSKSKAHLLYLLRWEKGSGDHDDDDNDDDQ